MDVMMVRAKVKSEHVQALESALVTMFSALEVAQPQGVRYASSRLPDGVTYLIVLALEQPEQNPLPSIPEFRAFQEGLKTWLLEPPIPEFVTVIGSYRLF